MPHPALGLPPSDHDAGHPAVAARLRAAERLPALSLDAAMRVDPTLRDRYDDLMLRRFLRDYERHIEQLARAVATGEARYVVVYGEDLVPSYRRRKVRMNDVVSLLRGLGGGCRGHRPSVGRGGHPRADGRLDRLPAPSPPARR